MATSLFHSPGEDKPEDGTKKEFYVLRGGDHD